MGSRFVLAYAIFFAASRPSPAAANTPPANAPDVFDFQARAGYPLSIEDRTTPFFASSEGEMPFMIPMIQALAGDSDAQQRFLKVMGQLSTYVPKGRQSIRILRSYQDQPVYITGGYAVASITGDPVVVSSVPDYCRNYLVNPVGNWHCVPLSRFAADNQAIGALFIGARTVIVKGVSKTHGLSLMILAENLLMSAAEDSIDLSAPQNPAPTLGSKLSYDYMCRPSESMCHEALTDTFSLDSASRFLAVPSDKVDLVWQYARARSVVPDWSWSAETDPCDDASITDAAAKLACRLDRDPRGLAGLAGGSIFAMAHRVNGFRVRSLGQAGGDGGTGYPASGSVCGESSGVTHTEYGPTCTTCGPCDYIFGCRCQYTYETPLSAFCRGDWKEPLDGRSTSCTYTCKYDRMTMGHPGGHAGPGGPAGLVYLVAVDRINLCTGGAFTETGLRTETGPTALDAQCLDGIDNDQSPGKVDCDSPFCYDNPDVTVCPGKVLISGSKPVLELSQFTLCPESLPFQTELSAGPPGQAGQGSAYKTQSCKQAKPNQTWCRKTATDYPTCTAERKSTTLTCSDLGPGWTRLGSSGTLDPYVCNRALKGKPYGNSAPTPPQPAVSDALVWDRSDWSRAVDKLQPNEWSRRIGRADSLFKQGRQLEASAIYMSVFRALRWIHNQGCADGVTTGDARRDYACGLDAAVRRHLDDIIHKRNYYGYPLNFIPPVAFRTAQLRELLNATLDQVQTHEQLWIDMGSVAALTSQMAGYRSTDLTDEKCQLVRSTTCGTTLTDLPVECRGTAGKPPPPPPDGCGVLQQQLDDANLKVDESRRALQMIKSQLFDLQNAYAQIHDQETDLWATPEVILEGLATAAATAAGGPAAGIAADWALNQIGTPSAQTGKDKVNDTGLIHLSDCQAYDGKLATEQGMSKCLSDGNGNVVQTPFFNKDGATWDETAKDAGKAAGKSAFNSLVAIAMGGSTQAVEAELRKAILEREIREWMFKAYMAGLDLGRAVRERDIVRAKVLEAQARIWQINSDVLALQQAAAVSAGTLPPTAIQLQIADAAFRAATRTVERAGEQVFLLRRAVERDTLPFDPAKRTSTLSQLEASDLASSSGTLYAACKDLKVSALSLDVTLLNWPCYRMWASWLGLFDDANGSNGTNAAALTIPIAPERYDSTNKVWRVPVTLTVEDVKGLSAGWGSHSRAKLRDMFVVVDTNVPKSKVGSIPIVIERGPENIFYLGQRLLKYNPSCPTCTVGWIDVLFNADFGKPPAVDGLLLEQLLSRPENYRHESNACHGAWDIPSDHPASLCWASNNNGPSEVLGSARAWFTGESLVGTMIVEVPKAQLDSFGSSVGYVGTVTPVALRTQIIYDYRYLSSTFVPPGGPH